MKKIKIDGGANTKADYGNISRISGIKHYSKNISFNKKGHLIYKPKSK